jgi:hypothetical protein
MSAEHPIYRAAADEVYRLRLDLSKEDISPKVKELLDALGVMEMYQGARAAKAVPPTPRVGGGVKRVEPESARVTREAKAYLTEIDGRASSGVIAKALVERGVVIGGKDKPARVSAYLSAAKDDFDNVRGEGYGIRRAPNGHAGH